MFWKLWLTEYHFEICLQFFRLHPHPPPPRPQKNLEPVEFLCVCVCVFFPEILFYDKAIYSVKHNTYIAINK